MLRSRVCKMSLREDLLGRSGSPLVATSISSSTPAAAAHVVSVTGTFKEPWFMEVPNIQKFACQTAGTDEECAAFGDMCVLTAPGGVCVANPGRIFTNDQLLMISESSAVSESRQAPPAPEDNDIFITDGLEHDAEDEWDRLRGTVQAHKPTFGELPPIAALKCIEPDQYLNEGTCKSMNFCEWTGEFCIPKDYVNTNSTVLERVFRRDLPDFVAPRRPGVVGAAAAGIGRRTRRRTGD